MCASSSSRCAPASCASAVVRASRHLQHLDVRRVDLFLAAGGGFGRPHRGELSAGRVELLLRHGELGVQADRFQLGFAEPQILLVVVDDAHRLLDRFLELRGQALALLRDGPQLELELLDLALRAQRALLDPCVPGRRLGLAGEPLERSAALPASCGTDPATARAAPQPRGPAPRPAVSPRLPPGGRVGAGGPHGLWGDDGPRLHATVGGVADHREEPSNAEDRDARAAPAARTGTARSSARARQRSRSAHRGG